MANKFKISDEALERLKAKWVLKINTQEEYEKLVEETNSEGLYIQNWIDNEYGTLQGSLPTLPVPSMRGQRMPWWLRRDAVREILGIYEEPTDVLKQVRTNGRQGLLFPHVAREDKTQVAYTIDKAGAIEDRKVRISLGRLLRKLYPQLEDHEIQELEADHRGELDGSFFLATTQEEVEHVYRAVAGDSCMRHDRSHWGLNDYHPSAVYTSPGMGVAYLKSGDKITARSVVWVNPDNPDDKRYVRLYGDKSLVKRLHRAGYRLAGLAGAKMLALRDSSFEKREEEAVQNYRDKGIDYKHKRYLMPYLDPAGGRDSSTREIDRVYTVFKYQGEDYLRLLSKADDARYRKVFGVTDVTPQQTDGYVSVLEVDPAKAQVTSPFSGKVYNLLEFSNQDQVWTFWQGSFQKVHSVMVEDYNKQAYAADESAIPADKMLIHTMRALVPGQSYAATVLCTKQDHDQFTIGEDVYNDKATREYFNLSQLSPVYYPGEQAYTTDGIKYWDVTPTQVDGVDSVQLTESEYAIRGSDGVKIHTLEQTVVVHKDIVKVFRKAGYKALGRNGGMLHWVHPEHPKLRTTVAGRLVHQDLHDVVEVPGGWALMREVRQGTMHHGLYILRDNPTLGLTNTWKEEIVASIEGCETVSMLKSRAARIVSAWMMLNRATFHGLHLNAEGQPVNSTYGEVYTVEDVVAAVNHPNAEAVVEDQYYGAEKLLWPVYKEAVAHINEAYSKRLNVLQADATNRRLQAQQLAENEKLLMCENITLGSVEGQLRWVYKSDVTDAYEAGRFQFFLADPDTATLHNAYGVRADLNRLISSRWNNEVDRLSGLSDRGCGLYEAGAVLGLLEYRSGFEQLAGVPAITLPGIAGERDVAEIQRRLAEETAAAAAYAAQQAAPSNTETYIVTQREGMLL